MILLLGYGKSNQSIAKYLSSINAEYIIYDDLDPKPISDFDMIIKSSGVSNQHFLIASGKPVISDLEFYYLQTMRLFPNKRFITVTGTNGKSTTVSLIGSIIQDADVCGNIGIPVFAYIYANNTAIIEASSYMLEGIKQYKSDISVILNLYPNHLDHHLNYINYYKAKMKLLLSTKDYIVYNYDDLLIRKLVMVYTAKKVPFSLKNIVDGCYIIDKTIYYRGSIIMDINDVKLVGEHNLANVLAAITVAILYKVDIKTIIDKVNDFKGLKHRIEYVTTIGETAIYNDSKATNYLALSKSLAIFKDKILTLICGGRSSDDTAFKTIITSNLVYKVITYGENRFRLNKILDEVNQPYSSSLTLKEACMIALDTKAEVILFSPGAQSFDAYRSFEERGEAFIDLMVDLKKQNKNINK